MQRQGKAPEDPADGIQNLWLCSLPLQNLLGAFCHNVPVVVRACILPLQCCLPYNAVRLTSVLWKWVFLVLTFYAYLFNCRVVCLRMSGRQLVSVCVFIPACVHVCVCVHACACVCWGRGGVGVEEDTHWTGPVRVPFSVCKEVSSHTWLIYDLLQVCIWYLYSERRCAVGAVPAASLTSAHTSAPDTTTECDVHVYGAAQGTFSSNVIKFQSISIIMCYYESTFLP